MTSQVELSITGMTCASCANRIERKLNKLDGVSASVNYATEKAWVEVGDGVGADDLVAAVVAAGYDATPVRAASSEADGPDGPDESTEEVAGSDPLVRRLLVCAVLTVPVVVIGMLAAFPGWEWVTFLLALPVVTWGAWPFHRATLLNLRHRSTTMDTLISLGVTVSTLWSIGSLVGDGDSYVEVATAVTTFLLAGRVLEHRAKRSAGAALRALMTLGAKQVHLLPDGPDGAGGAEVTVPVERLRVGDHFVVRPGERVATDGVVAAGASAIDASLVTGESVPVEVAPGDPVVGGTLNATGRLVVRATGVGADTQLARIARLVEEAQNGKAAAQRLADRVSAIFVPTVLVLALLTFLGWLATGGSASDAMTAAVAVLIVACPCALGLATPTALLVGTGRGAQLGVLLRGPEVLEQTRRIDTVVLDKTGTVTRGELRLVSVSVAVGESEEVVRMRAAAVESASEHPIARAICASVAGPVREGRRGDTPGSARRTSSGASPDGEPLDIPPSVTPRPRHRPRAPSPTSARSLLCLGWGLRGSSTGNP